VSSELIPFDHQERMAQAIAKSGLFGLKDVTQVLALMAVAQAEGRHPASVAKDYHIIQGRPALKADAMLARFQAAGGRVDWKIYTDEEVTGVFSHPQGGSLTVSWTFKTAKAIGLATKDNWRLYPRAMLRARVISEGVRSVYPAVLVGEYTPEEVQDFVPSPKTPEMIEAVVEQIKEVKQASDGIPLYVPGADGQPSLYSVHETRDAWVDAYFDLSLKIRSSKKLSEEEVNTKMEALKTVNAANIGKYIDNEDAA
jgi:hypothetical protein